MATKEYNASHKKEIKQYNHKHYLERKAEGKETFQKKRNKNLKNRYGIEEVDYKNLYIKQNGKCAICNKHFDILCVDHNHITNKTRALLCKRCNTSFSWLYEDIKIIFSLLKYAVKYYYK